MTSWPLASWFLRLGRRAVFRPGGRSGRQHPVIRRRHRLTALLLISVPKFFAAPVRILGIVSAVLFIVTAARIFWGEPHSPTATPLPSYAYPLLVAIGYIWTLWREA
jgi:hypothetical protein